MPTKEKRRFSGTRTHTPSHLTAFFPFLQAESVGVAEEDKKWKLAPFQVTEWKVRLTPPLFDSGVFRVPQAVQVCPHRWMISLELTCFTSCIAHC